MAPPRQHPRPLLAGRRGPDKLPHVARHVVPGDLNVSRILSAVQSAFPWLSLWISACISSAVGGRPGLRLDLQRHNSRKAVLCHFFTVAGCMRRAQHSLPAKTSDTTSAFKQVGQGIHVSMMR